jgi:hypothetical protein
MPIIIGVLLETVLSIRSVQSGYKEELSWESAVEFRNSKWIVTWEPGSAWKSEKTALWVQVWSVNQRTTRDHRSWRISIVEMRYYKTSCENTPEEQPLLGTATKQRLVKVIWEVFNVEWFLVWKSARVLQLPVVPSRVYKWSINPLSNPYPVYSHTPKSW